MALSLPEDASTGLTPHNAANEDSLRNRCGLSPAAMRSVDAESGPIPRNCSNAGAADLTAVVMRCWRSWISSASCTRYDKTADRGVRDSGGETATCLGIQVGGTVNEPAETHRSEFFAQLRRGVDHDSFELVARLHLAFTAMS
ncbi:hypothetical protein ACWDKQ_15450 [Saccharopolyspora sp. NPDC000995]